MVKSKTISNRLCDFLIHTVLIIIVIITLYPILNIVATSFSSANAVEKNLITFYPKEFTFKGYETVLKNNIIPNSFRNSSFYTAIGTVISLFLSTFMAYPLSKKNLPLKKFYMVILIITMYFSGGLIPSFLLVKGLGMYDSIWAMVLPCAISTYYVIIMISFFKSLPKELEESAFLDGANDVVILFRIVLPLSTASIATIGLFYAVSYWNDWFTALIYLKSLIKYPLPLILRELIIEDRMADLLNMDAYAGRMDVDQNNRSITTDTLKYAALFISMIPMLIIYPFVQKYFVKGVMIGSIKG